MRFVPAAAAALAFAVALPAVAAPADSVPSRLERGPLLAAIRALRVEGGKYDGAVRAFSGGGVNWYLANIGLRHVVRADPGLVRAYLDAYVRNLDPLTATIGDAEAAPNGPPVIALTPDSHDAYAGTFLSLAVRYAAVTHDRTWIDAHLDALKSMAYQNILMLVKPNGLVRVFRNPPPGGVDPDQAAVGYLMDNCEDYGGLRDLVALLEARHDRDAAYFRSFLAPLAAGIGSLFDLRVRAWRYSDEGLVPKVRLYPDCAAQFFPQAFGVPGTAALPATRQGARRFVLELCASNLATGPSDLNALLAYQLKTSATANDADKTVALRLARYALATAQRSPFDANVATYGWLLGTLGSD